MIDWFKVLLLFVLLSIGLGSMRLASAQLAGARSMSTSDPNLNSSWDWTQCRRIDIYATSRTSKYQPLLPFCNNDSPVFVDITSGDVEPSDGWRLMYRDFGTSSSRSSEPRFILYNRYTGEVRVFLFNTNSSGSYSRALASVKIDNAGSSQNTIPPYQLLDFYNTKEVVAPINYVNERWVYFTFFAKDYIKNIGDSKFTDAIFVFEVYGIQDTSFDFSGGITLNAAYSNDGNSTNFFSKAGSLLSAIGGEPTANFIRQFKNTGEVEPPEDPKSTRNRIIELAAAGLESYVPGIGQVAGAIGSFIGGTSSSRLTQLSGDITLKGTSQSIRSNLNFFTNRIPGAQRSNNQGAPLFDDPLGVYSLSGEPIKHDFSTICSYYYCTFNLDIYGQSVSFDVNSQQLVGSSSATVDVSYAITNEITGFVREGGAYPSDGYTSDPTDFNIRCSETYQLDECNIGRYKKVVRATVTPDPLPSPDFVPVEIFKTTQIAAGNYQAYDSGNTQTYSKSPSADDSSARTKQVEIKRKGNAPKQTMIVGNFPNPTQSRSTIEFKLSNAGPVRIDVFDMMGRRVYTVTDKSYPIGSHRVSVDVTGLSSGAYLYRLQTEQTSDSGRLTVIR